MAEVTPISTIGIYGSTAWAQGVHSQFQTLSGIVTQPELQLGDKWPFLYKLASC